MARQRPSWDAYFLKMAHVCAERATCDRKLVGAVIVRDNHPIATGYNGAPPGLPHCDDPGVGHLLREVDGRPSCHRATHAEQNAIITAGIRRVVWDEGYPEPVSLEFLKEAGIDLVHMPQAPQTPV